MVFIENIAILLTALFTGTLLPMVVVQLAYQPEASGRGAVDHRHAVQPYLQIGLGLAGALAALAVGLAGGGGARWLLAGAIILVGSLAVRAARHRIDERDALWLRGSASLLAIVALALVGFTCHQAA